MQNAEREARLERFIQVRDEAGNAHSLEEIGVYARYPTPSGWSPWLRISGEIRLNGQYVNETDDPNVFELPYTRERLTAVNPQT